MTCWRFWLLAKLRIWNHLAVFFITLTGTCLQRADRVKENLARLDEAEEDGESA